MDGALLPPGGQNMNCSLKPAELGKREGPRLIVPIELSGSLNRQRETFREFKVTKAAVQRVLPNTMLTRKPC